jgi:LuxR family maltose regulon positive regulatory protein
VSNLAATKETIGTTPGVANDLRDAPAPHLEPVRTRAIRHFSRLDALPPLLLVVAPTGYGKTIFLSTIAAHLRRGGCRTLLHTLDEGESEFSTALLRIEQLLGCTSMDVGMMFCGGPVIESDSLIDNIVQAAERLDEDAVLLLDGFDAARDTELGHLIERVTLGRLTRLRIVLTTTELPAEILHRVRLQGGTKELGPAELSMGSDEIRELFATAQVNPVSLTADQLAEIKAQTEGWPAAVRLMHVAMSSHVDADALPVGKGFETSLTDTLSRRVLAALDPTITQFLFEIADLETFNAELCAHMTGNGRAGEILADLIRLNLMIFPATGRPGWYRLHNLFRDFLRRESHSAHDERARNALLGRALDWCRRNGHLHDAFELALSIRDGQQASELLAARAQRLVRDQGQIYYYITAYERLIEIEAFPADEAQYWYVWAMMFARQYEKAYRVLASMRHGNAKDAPDDRMLQHKQAPLSTILFSLDRISEARTRGERWLEADEGLDPFETSGVACVVSTSGVAELDFQAARRGIQLARSAMSRACSEYGLAWISCLESLIDVEEGDTPFDVTPLNEAIERARRTLGPLAPIISTMDIMAARIALERGELDEARERVLHGLSQAKQHGFIETTKVALEVAIRLWDGRQDSVFAPRHLDAVATSFPPRLQLILNCYVLVRLVRLGLTQQALDWARRQDLEGLLGPRPPAFPASQLGSARRALTDARLAWLIAQRDFSAALTLVEAELQPALKSSCASWKVHLLLTRVEILSCTGQTTQAAKSLLRAIGIAAPRHLRQPFVEFGHVIRPLISGDDKKQWPLVTEEELTFFADLKQRLNTTGESERSAGASEPARENVDLEAPTPRELELLGYLDGGLSNQDIADRLGLTVGTVKWHLHNLFMKLGVRNRSAALFKAKRVGLLNR